MRKPGIEPGTSVWETNILPLNYLRRMYVYVIYKDRLKMGMGLQHVQIKL